MYLVLYNTSFQT